MQFANKKIGLLGTYGFVNGSAFLSTKELLTKVGNNTGNLLFQYAVNNLIDEDKLVIGADIPWDVKKVKETCRILVIPSANFLRENFDLTNYINFLESCDLPLLFIGLGAQSDNYANKTINFHPSINRLIEIIKDQNIGVGIRGAFTAEILSDHGISNMKIIGCPSNFINPTDNLIENLKNKWKKNIERLLTTADEPWPKNPVKQEAERRLVKYAIQHSGVYVQQSVDPFVRILRKSNPHQQEIVEDSTENSLRHAIAPSLDPSDFKRFLSTTVKLYISVDQWMEDASRFDLGIGLRLHGNMAALQSGCPSIWIYHDSRTQELVETMALPSLSIDEFLKFESVNEIRENVNPDFDKYKTTRLKLRHGFNELLMANNIIHT